MPIVRVMLAATSLAMLAGVWQVAVNARPQDGATDQAQAFRFHHAHLNSTDPARAIDFYASHFNAARGTFDGRVPGVNAQGKWLLFTRVGQPPAWPVVSPLYHIGWGAPDMKTTFERLRGAGVPFEAPITDISQVIEAPSGRVFFAYVDGPDHLLIEINTAATDAFQHVHLLSDDPVSAGQWYLRHFGGRTGNANPSREARSHNGLQIYPFMGLNLDGIQFFWYPKAFGQGSYPDAWKGRTAFASSRGRTFDHFAFSVTGLDAALSRLEAAGVTVLQRPRATPEGFRSAFVQAPDGVELELVDGHLPR